MKNVLILAYDYPPKISIGSQRPLAWFKYFNEFDLTPTVVTRFWEENNSDDISIRANRDNKNSIEHFDSGNLIRSVYKPNLRDILLVRFGNNRFNFLRKALTVFYSVASHLSFSFDSTSSIYKSANEFIKNNKVHAIIATGEPFILFRYASKLSSSHNIPWIADYRDCWTTDNLRNQSFLARIFNKFYFKKLEVKYLSNANLITTAAPSYKSKISQLSKNRIEIIYNGFFEEIHNSPVKAETEKFTISYAGTIYDFQPIELFINALKELDNKLNIKLNFYGIGKSKEDYLKQIQFNSIQLNIFNKIPQEQLIKKIRHSNMLLLLASPEEERLAAKIFDYLPLDIPILLSINDNGILNSIISETESGIVCQNIDDIKTSINNTYTNWVNGLKCFNSKNYQKYTRRNQTKILANLIKEL